MWATFSPAVEQVIYGLTGLTFKESAQVVADTGGPIMSAAIAPSLPHCSVQDSPPAGERIHSCRRRPVPQDTAILRLVASLLKDMGPSLDRQQRVQLARDLLSPGGKGRRQPPEMSVAKLCRLHLRHARTYYQKTNGGRTSEVDPIRYALQPLRRLFGRKRVSEFGPLRLKQVREEMVAAGWHRKTVNEQVGRIKRMFKWGGSDELIPADVYHALQAVDGLRMGRTTAPESSRSLSR